MTRSVQTHHESPTPGEILRVWQRGACELLQNIHRSVQQLHSDVLLQSCSAIQHVQNFQRQRGARGVQHAAFASLTSSLPFGQLSKRSTDGVRSAGKGRNCAIGSLADSSNTFEHQPTQATPWPANGDGNQERLLVSEVHIRGIEGPLKEAAEKALNLKPNFSYTAAEIQSEIANVFGLGWFQEVYPISEDTRDGIKLTIQLDPNPPLRGVTAQGGSVLPAYVIQDAFQNQIDKTLNFTDFHAGKAKVDRWYEDRGIWGKVLGIGFENDVAELKVTECKINSINLQWQDKVTGETKDEGVTKPEIVLRRLSTKPGQVSNLRQIQHDVQVLDSLGIFKDTGIFLLPAPDSTNDNPTFDLTFKLKESIKKGTKAGFGISAQGHAEGAVPGFIGSFGYQHNNLFGLNQKLEAAVEVGQANATTFRLTHTDPWVGSDPHRTSRTLSLLGNTTSGNVIHAKAQDDGSSPQTQTTGPDGNVKVARLLGGVEYARPLAQGWSGTLGVNFQRASCLNDHNQIMIKDCYNAPLTFSRSNYDTMMVALIRCVYTGRHDSQVLVSMEQALPAYHSWLNFNRLRLRVERSFPLGINPRFQVFLSGKGGAIIGDLPPYEAFPIGGTASVRGYGEGAVGSGRNFAAGTAELHFPLIDPVEGTLLFDYGTDLDSGASVLGDPAGMRGKPGKGWGYGAGIRIASPFGPLRFEYAWNKEGRSRVHLGIGHG